MGCKQPPRTDGKLAHQLARSPPSVGHSAEADDLSPSPENRLFEEERCSSKEEDGFAAEDERSCKEVKPSANED